MARAAKYPLLLALAVVGGVYGCVSSDPVTQIVLEIGTDLAMPGEMNGMRLEVIGEHGRFETDAPYRLGAGAGEIMLPRRVTLVPVKSKTAAFNVKVTGLKIGDGASPGTETVIVERRVSLAFVPGRSLLLRLDLLRACVGKFCDAGETCGPAGKCVTQIILSNTLPVFDRHKDPAVLPSPGDGGVKDARKDVPGDARSDDGPPRGLGVECISNENCLSGSCIDGVCCLQKSCAPCFACNTLGRRGFCSVAFAGTNPRGDCRTELASSCGLDGTCDGFGACRLHRAGTVCAPSKCSSDGWTQSQPRTCNGLGTCLLVANETLCAPGHCSQIDGDICVLTCKTITDCAPDSFCKDGKCDGKLGGGAVCVVASDCSSGRCIDGVCCKTDCTGTCQACNLTGTMGTCTPVPPGQDPGNECADDGAPSCGQSGACDGHGACGRYPDSTECAAASCADATTVVQSRTCTGAGVCRASQERSCAPNRCVGAGECSSGCAKNDDCAPGAFCKGGVCDGQLGAGAACGSASECLSGLCVDGVCCKLACAGTCEACNLPGSLGTCSPVPAGQDPRNTCKDEGAASCGQDGACDGLGACRKYADGEICVPATCKDAVTAAQNRSCDGKGTCRPANEQNCAPGRCSSAACTLDCTSNTECAPGGACIKGRCSGKLGNGFGCGAASECGSDRCVDGVCCDGDCAGTCQACNLPGALGACTPIPAGQDPGNECDDQGAVSCGRNGSCNGASACALYPAGTGCAAPVCAGNIENGARACNGGGVCTAAVTRDCQEYVCSAGACQRPCSVNSHCVAGYVCFGGVCVIPGVEKCTNGIDDDYDGLTDCADPECSTAGYSCVPLAPSGWLGPVALYDGKFGTLPPCTGTYGAEVATAYRDLTCPSTCTACTCGAPVDASCDSAAVSFSKNMTCEDLSVGPPATSTCISLDLGFDAMGAQADGGPGTSDKCAVSSTAMPGPASFGNVGRTCGTAFTFGTGGCSGNRCMPRPAAPFESLLCIYHAGDLPCPVAGFVQRRVFYASAGDGRGCTGCGCGAPLGILCGGAMTFFADNSCADAPLKVDLPLKCADITKTNLSMVYSDPVVTDPGSCAPTGGQPTGSCSPTGATTVCCLPAVQQ